MAHSELHFAGHSPTTRTRRMPPARDDGTRTPRAKRRTLQRQLARQAKTTRRKLG